jgi:hypothetical protein
MGRADEASQLRAALRRGLAARLEGSAWSAVQDGREGPFVLAQLVRPLADGFAATAEVLLSSVSPDRPPVLVNDVSLGLAYEPLRRLWPLLGDRFQLALVATSAREADDDESALFELGATREVPHAVEALASVILDRAVPYAQRYASFDALLAAFADGDDIRRPALLAAAGRFDEAAAALARYEPPRESGAFARQERRTAYQLRRWVSSRGDPSLLPDGPPPSALDDTPRRPSFAQATADVRARREAVEEVRRAGPGRDREAVRALLEDALARRGVTESPLSIEFTLDHLWDTPADRVRQGFQGLKALSRFGLGLAKAIRDHELPDMSTPEWLEPPEPAFYELPRGDRWIEAALDRGVEDWLERVRQEARPRAFGLASLHAWLAPAPDGIAVHIGDRRIGLIAGDAVPAYAPVMRAAAFREELPCLRARLARRGQPPRPILELALPPA